MKFKLTAAGGNPLIYPLDGFRTSNEETHIIGKVPPQWIEGSCDIEFDTLEELIEFAKTIFKDGCKELILGFDDKQPTIMIYDDYIE